MTTVSEEAREGSAAAAEQPPEITADARAQARAIVTLPSPASLKAATRRVRVLRWLLARAAGIGAGAARLPARAGEFLDRPESLVHHHPPTFARARELHHEAAGRHSVPLFTGLRLTWGYLHLILLKPVLNFLEWVTETPLRFSVAVILFTVIWIWS